MLTVKIVLWVCIGIVFYSYVGYGIILWIIVKIKAVFRKPKSNIEGNNSFEPEITLIVSAFNEEAIIESKIKNTFQLSYPDDKLKLIFITDGSNDSTPEIVKKYPGIQLLHLPERRGKVAAMNRAMNFVTTPYVVFSDANTLLNRDCIIQISKHYADPRVGGVAGEKKVIARADAKAAGAGEGIYWKYESFLKKLDAEFYSVVGAAGELFSVRTDLFEQTAENIIIEDFVQSLKICMKGFVIKYEPLAYAIEDSSSSIKEEQKRKIRISAGAFQAMIILKGLFNIFKYPTLAFQFISHRILRWTLCPLCILAIFILNTVIIAKNGGIVFFALFFAQIVFYIAAFAGWFFANRNIKIKSLYIPYYLLFMNISVFLGFKRFIKKQQSVLWEKAKRQPSH
ncbi:MAG: glycosyltransferase family 2 protein [Bacteroidetes bacterium]|nr:glycosyltransferase family 2 protein [Bacteroidota bacterium]